MNTEFFYHGVSEAICMTSSWFKKHSGNEQRTQMSYSRSNSPNNRIVCEKIKEAYSLGNNSKVVLFPSGINAIASCFEIFSKKNATILIANEVYCDTTRALNFLSKRIEGLKFESFDIRDDEDLIRLAKKHKESVTLIFLESCSNPGGLMINPDVLTEVKKHVSKECVLCVDNSWLSSTYNPFKVYSKYGIETIVMESLTKYMGGGRIVMGAIMGVSGMTMKKVYEYYKIMGTHISPFDCWCLSEMLESLTLRMKHTSDCSMKIAQFLEKHEKVNRVMYPMLESHPSFKIAKKYLNLGPGIIYFHVSKDKKAMIKLSNDSKEFGYATSYGKNINLLSEIAEGDHCLYDFDKNEKKKGCWVRLAVGWNCKIEKTLAELKRMLEKDYS